MIKSKQWNFSNLFTKFIWMEIKIYLNKKNVLSFLIEPHVISRRKVASLEDGTCHVKPVSFILCEIHVGFCV